MPSWAASTTSTNGLLEAYRIRAPFRSRVRVMSTDLAEWHAWLHAHFAALRAKRRQEGGWAVFALEHELSSIETQNLASAIHAELRRERVRHEHWWP